MSDPSDVNPEATNLQSELELVIAAYIRASEAGSPPDWQQILKSHPQFAVELRQFFAQRDRMNQLVVPIRSCAEDLYHRVGPGQQISYVGNYELLHEIARGGMGIVYKARQTTLGRIVAVKMIVAGRLASDDDVKRFQIEASAAAGLQHPNIVSIHEVGQHEGWHYFSMDFVTGRDLSAILRENLLPARQAAGYVAQMAEAIHYAHQQGTLHRDLKPSNILIDDHDQVRITDFGLAMRVEGDSDLTRTGQIVGTPSYMPPEQAQGKRSLIGPGSDVYSLGAVLYECLTGRPPFRAGSVVETIQQVIHTEAASPRSLNPHIPRDLETICLKCLQKEPHRRYGTAQLMAEDLTRFLEGRPIVARPVNSVERLRRWCLRNRAVAGLTATVALSLVTGSAISASFAVEASRRADSEAIFRKKADEKTTEAFKEKSIAQTQTEFARKKEAEAIANAALADKNLAEAQRQEQIAISERDRAQQAELLARRRLYASQLNLAHQAWELGQTARTLDLLEGQRPKADQKDLRGFEWYYLWNLCNGGRALSWKAHQSQINGLAISPDGKLLATGGEGDTKVKLWDLATGTERRFFIQAGSRCLSFSPDGKTLCVGSFSHLDAGLRLWDLETGVEQQRMPGDPRDVSGVAFSPDGSMLAAHYGNGIVFVWDMNSRQVRHKIQAHTVAGPVAFSPDGKRLATASHWGDMTTKIWDLSVDPPQIVHNWNGSRSIAFSPDGNLLAGADESSAIRLWDIRTGERYGIFQGHQGAVSALAFSPDGTTLASGAHDRTLQFWEVATRREYRNQPHLSPVLSLAFSPDGAKVVTGSIDGHIKVLDVSTTAQSTSLQHEGAVHRLYFNEDGSSLISGGDFPTKRWNVATEQVEAIFPVQIHEGFLSRDFKTLAIVLEEGRWKLIDMETGRERAVLTEKAIGPWRADFSPDGKTVVTGGRPEQVWDLTTYRLQSMLPILSVGVTSHIAHSPDGKFLALGTQWNYARIWNIAERRYTWNFGEGGNSWIWAIAFSRDGKVIATGNDQGSVRLWDMDNGKLIASLRGHTDAIRTVAFSADGQSVATASADKTVRVWDVATGQERMTLKGHAHAVNVLVFSPDGTILATGSSDGTVRLWRAPMGQSEVAFKTELDPYDPSSAVATNLWGDRLKRAARHQEAETLYRQLIPQLEMLVAQFPRVPDYLQELARSRLAVAFVMESMSRIEVATDEFNRSMQLFDLVAERFPSTSDSRRGLAYEYTHFLGTVFSANRQRTEASVAYGLGGELYRRLADANPSNTVYREEAARATSMRANLLHQIGRNDDASRLYQQAIADYERLVDEPSGGPHRQSLANIWNLMGASLASSDRFRDSEAAYRKAVDLAPTVSVYCNNLAWLLATCPDTAQRNPQQALQWALKAVELRPTAGGHWNTLGVAHFRNADWDASISALTKSIELTSGGDSSDFFFLAMAHWHLGNQDKARQWMDQARQSMQRSGPQDRELQRFRAESAELLGQPVELDH